jgi:DNA-binding NarL/FixJ family response regulator
MSYATEAAQKTDSNVQAPAGLTVLIADDHYLVREGLKLCLGEIDRAVTTLESDTIESTIAVYQSCPDIDLVLLDLEIAGSQGREAIDEFAQRCPEARIVVMSEACDMKTVQAVLGQGVLGFIPKLARKATFLNALRFVLEGGIYVPPEALLPCNAAADAPAATAEQAQRAADSAAALRGARLTARQVDVLAQLIDGKPNKQICRELNLSLGTVKCHVGAILGALEVNSRAEAIAAANKRGMREWLSQHRQETVKAPRVSNWEQRPVYQ